MRDCSEIPTELNRRGILSPKGRLWQHTTVKALIENPTYRGDLTWNLRTESKFYEVRERRADRQKVRARSGRIEKVSHDWIAIEDALPAILERDVWERAQEAASARPAYAPGLATNLAPIPGAPRPTVAPDTANRALNFPSLGRPEPAPPKPNNPSQGDGSQFGVIEGG